ncbi:L,D-transpeptidase family protein [Hyphomicrobium sp.]|uniref:L,D-transpeptidase family protein n=1 Tax=Hyphomicrobium sp. TaxID=82 RepID=UPI002E35E358|nr:L,D-transpeptidase family protein [Hyphomicrobium sp.]HEX2842973.1 L,D-transpeptidase family protein [Hyphomicrobium sp.]
MLPRLISKTFTSLTLTALLLGIAGTTAALAQSYDRYGRYDRYERYDRYRYNNYDRDYYRPQRARKPEQSKPKEEEAKHQEPLAGPPRLAVVSIRDQRISVYDGSGAAVRARISSGQTGYETPVGVYSILQKNKDHYSNLYDDASMPFMQRLTWSGIALHAGALPGYPASHGCVRLPHNYAEQIFPLSKLGMRVVVARNDIAPVEIAHPLLFKPTVAGTRPVTTQIAYAPDGGQQDEQGNPFEPDVSNWPERQALLASLRSAAAEKMPAAEAATARSEELAKVEKTKTAERAKTAKTLKRAESAKQKADERVDRAKKQIEEAKSDKQKKSAEDTLAKATAAATKAAEDVAKAQADDKAPAEALAAATAELAAANAAKTAAVNVAQEAKRKTLPVSVFISLKKQHLYVRQGHEPVFDTPVTIAEPEKPIGTFVYTAVDYTGSGNDVRWMAVSTGPRELDDYYDRTEHKNGKKDHTPPPTDLSAATAALDRITLPPDVAPRLSEYVWPGSSIIVSDEDVSKETGKATDFVVLISGEPQGGIKKRPRQPAPDYYRYYGDDYYYYDRRNRRAPSYTPFFSFW